MGVSSFQTILQSLAEPLWGPAPAGPAANLTEARGRELYAAYEARSRAQTSRLFAVLFGAQWLLLLGLALWFTPLTWIGATSELHLHVVATLTLGTLCSGYPIWRILRRPADRGTLTTVAVAQMATSALLIHITGGRIESHFHVFGSLSFLAFYRDVRVILVATVVVAADHAVRGTFFPWSVFGVFAPQNLRWVEHAAWVVFQDLFLLYQCRRLKVSGWAAALREAELEHTRAGVERVVAERTAELVEARDRALVADRLKSEFLANVSHELRTPLNGILGLTEGLLEAGHPEPDPERRTALETVRRCAEGLRVTVTDLLELSGRPLDGEAPVEVAFEPAELARSVVASFAAQAGEKGVELAVATGPGSHGRCLGDAARLRRALERLVSNAVKYTDRGHCRVEVAVERVGERPWLRLGVVDTGLGIAAEELERIFQPFALVDGSSTRLRGGVGAGLPLARRTAESLGGRLDVHSELGRGSTFTLCVPVQGAAAAAESVEAPPAALPERRPRGPLRVLVAEDNPINQRVMVARLGRGGHQVTVVDDGEQAVSAATAGGFDLVLMDLQMPRMDGIEAARQIRARLGTAPPIVAVTAHAYQFEWGRCSAAGIDDYLTKPFGQAELEAVLQRVAGGAPAPE